jgi:hypothetical protein
MTKAIEERGARDIAKRALETTGQVFRYVVIAHGYARRNPAAEIRPKDILKQSRKVNHARIDSKELSDLLKKVEVYSGKPTTRLAIKLTKPRGFYLVRSVVCFVLAFLLYLRFLLVGSALTSPYTCV